MASRSSVTVLDQAPGQQRNGFGTILIPVATASVWTNKTRIRIVIGTFNALRRSGFPVSREHDLLCSSRRNLHELRSSQIRCINVLRFCDDNSISQIGTLQASSFTKVSSAARIGTADVQASWISEIAD